MMTKTALENKKLATQKQLKEKDAEIAAADRKSREDIAKRDRIQKYYGDTVRAASRMFMPLKINHPEWYKKLPGIDYTVNPPRFFPLGVLTDPTIYGSNYTGGTSRLMVKTLRYWSAFGPQPSSVLANNPINVAMANLQTSLRSRNSRIGEYEPGDLGQVLVASTELHVLMKIINMALRLANTFYVEKNYIAEAICTSWGMSFTDIVNNRIKYIDMYNVLAARINKSVFIPDGFTYYERKLFVAACMISDDDTGQSGVVTTYPLQVGVYDEANAVVNFVSLYSAGQFNTLTAYFSRAQQMLGNLYNSAVLTTMFADIKSACDKFYEIPTINPQDTIEFLKSDEPRIQLLNTTLPFVYPYTSSNTPSGGLKMGYNVFNTNGFTNGGSLSLRQNTDGLLYQGETTWTGFPKGPELVVLGDSVSDTYPIYKYDKFMLNFYHDNPTPDDILEATRNKTHWVQVGGVDDIHLYADVCGTEVFIDEIMVWRSNGSQSIPNYTASWDIICHQGLLYTSSNTSTIEARLIAARDDFDYCEPWVINAARGTVSGSGVTIYYPIASSCWKSFSLGRHFPIKFEEVNAINNFAITSLFQVDGLSHYSR